MQQKQKSEQYIDYFLLSLCLHLLIIAWIFFNTERKQSLQVLPITPQQDVNTYHYRPILQSPDQHARVIFKDIKIPQLTEPAQLDMPIEKPILEKNKPQVTTPQPDITHSILQEKPRSSNAKIRSTQKEKNEIAEQKTKQVLQTITRGFMKSMLREYGENYVPATEKERIRNIYSTKIIQMMRHSSFLDKECLFQKNNHDQAIIADITINKNGALKKLSIRGLDMIRDTTLVSQQSHKNDLIRIEKMLTKYAQSLGLFPPIPKELKQESITIAYDFILQTRDGIHKYHITQRPKSVDPTF